MKRIMVFVVLALVALATSVQAETLVSPKSFQSLQPFKSFQKGGGEGVAYRYDVRNKAQFVALLRDPKLAKKEMRVNCDVLVRQMVEAHKDLPFEGCEGAAAAIENNNDFAVVAGKDEMFLKDNWLAVTNENGSAFGVWHRKCLPDEQVLVYKNQPIISLTCLNVAIPVKLPTPVAETIVTTVLPTKLLRSTATAACPKGIALIVNAWERNAVCSASAELCKKVDAQIAAAADRDSENASNPEAYKGDAFSRTLGDELIRTVNVRAPIGANITAQLLNPKLEVVQDLGSFTLVDGIIRIPLTGDQRGMIVQTIWPAWFSSPVVSGAARRLLFFPKEWEKESGGRYCTMNEHGVYKKENKP